VTLYAQWAGDDFDVTYKANNGTAEESVDGTGQYGVAYTVLGNTFSRDNCSFTGWNTQADGLGTAYTVGQNIPAATSGELTLYAQWAGDPYTVSYDPNGGTGTAYAVGTDYATDTFALDNATDSNLGYAKTNYTFNGWNTLADGTGTAYAVGAAITGPVPLYAQWLGDFYDVDYDPNGGDGTAYTVNDAGRYGVDYTIEANSFSLENYRFLGWNTQADGLGDDYGAGEIVLAANAGPLTLYAQWTLDIYDVTYDPNGGAGAAYTKTNFYGAPYTVLSNSDANLRFGKVESVFAGWNTAADGSGTAYAAGKVIPAAEVGTLTLYAQWTPVSGGGGCGSCFSWLYDSLLYFFMGFGWLSR